MTSRGVQVTRHAHGVHISIVGVGSTVVRRKDVDDLVDALLDARDGVVRA